MSEEQLKAFREAVKADADLQKQIKAAGDVGAVVAMAQAAGFVLTAEDALKALAGISEDELAGVQGGASIDFNDPAI